MVEILRYTHIIGGTLLLIIGLIQLILPKNGARHRNIGNAYVAIMLIVCTTSMYLSCQRMLEGIAFGSIFLFSIGLFSLNGMLSGYLLGKFKSNRSLVLGKLMVFFGCISGLFLLAVAYTFWNAVGLICLPFGLLQMVGAWQDFKYYFKPNSVMQHGSWYWIFGHSGRMIGSYIACVTAFLVNVCTCPYPIVLWLGPTVVGFIAIVFFQRRLRRQLPI